MKTLTVPIWKYFVLLGILFSFNFGFSQYCSSNGNNTSDEYIGRVQLNTIDNSSGAGTTSTGYSNFTGISTSLMRSTGYTITITPTWTGSHYPEAYRVWIDYNQDNDFADSGEQVASIAASTTSPVSASFTIPGGATLGNTRMRVSMKYNGYPSYCETFSYGEVEDYTINIISATPSPEINVIGNGLSISDGDTSPNISDDTDFGDVDVSSGTATHTFTIQNTGTANLNLTGSSPYVTISGSNAADFTLTATPSTPVSSSNSTTFEITFNPSATGTRTASLSIANNDSDENPYTFDIQGNGIVPSPEMDVQGNSVSIADGDNSPSTSDNTDFGSTGIGTSIVRTFTIYNTGNADLNLTGSSPYISFSGANASDFSVSVIPNTPVSANHSTIFKIKFTAGGLGTRNATLSIANNDSNENPYNFSVRGTGTLATGICTTTINSYPYTESFESGFGGWTQDVNGVTDNFNWSRLNWITPTSNTGPNSAKNGNYFIFTESDGPSTGNYANLQSPCFNLTGLTNPRLTLFQHMYGSNMGTLKVELSTDNGTNYSSVLFSQSGEIQNSGNSSWIPISVDLSPYVGQTVKIRLQGIRGSGSRSDMAIDYVTLTDRADPIYAPGGVVSDLSLWLKANDGLGLSDGQSVTNWQDQGLASDAKVHTSGQEPTYRDNVNKNINFNPVIEFDNTYSSFSIDSDYSHNNTSTEFLTGDYGYYTEDIFIVIIPDNTNITSSFGFMDVICGDSHLDTNATDTTGIGFGDFTGRISNEVICYAHDTYQTSESGDGYAVAQTGSASYDNVGIINTRNNNANTQQELYYNANNIETLQNDVAEYMNTDDTRYWIGRSEGWEATTNARIPEVISYKTRKNDSDLTQERNRIQSYLALKYGITLGTNGTSQDYVNSDGTVIWDADNGTPSESVFNNDIAGIGRDDASELYQKQSRSVNNASDGTGRTQGILTMGLSQVYNTNNLNPNTLNDKEFLIWGNDGINLNNPAVVVDVDMSTNITPTIAGGSWVQFNGIARTWKVVEVGGDIPSVEVQVLKNAIRTATPPDGRYLMFISDTPNFDPTADYRVMTETTNELGEAIVSTDYDFDGTKYITFGWAPERIYTRSVKFTGATADGGNNDYIDMEDALDLNSTFTVSAWIKRDTGSENRSILSKRDASYTEGYDLKIDGSGRVQMSWKNGSTQTITSDVAIPTNVWHHIAVIYSGGSARMYIDGVLEKTASLSAPTNTTQSFYIGAAGKNTPTAYFIGSIDEVRVWNAALTEAQLHYIMNQEIENNAGFVRGSYFESRGITPTKNDIASVPWSSLAGYYPMTTYTYTNTKDESGNGHQGALRHLRTVDRQTAPLPYSSASSGNWDTNATWANGSMQTKPGATSLANTSVTVDWNIVETNHNITMDNTGLPAGNNGNRNVLALFVDSNELTVDGDNSTDTGYGLTVTHYLNLDGNIDLNGESQLIQTEDSDLEVASSGVLERDQQGTRDLYTYNYWSSPVGVSNTSSNNNSYTLPNIFRDGTNPASPTAINFLTSGYNGTSGSPIGIADYWIWKYSNQAADDYPSWQHVRSTGTISPAEGFTMKGVANTSGNITLEQNYTYIGKPNNGDINLTMSSGNEYLVGNPYPSAMDANQFILDNISVASGGNNPSGNIINGVLYFWDHFAVSTHNLAQYQGGYATYTLMGGVEATSTDTRIDATGLTGTKRPERYIPVGQGFFVSTVESIPTVTPVVGGTIEFNNGQRIFKKEAVSGTNTGSVFFRTNESTSVESSLNAETDNRMKIRLKFDSPKGYHRAIMAGVDPNASDSYDLAYDAPLNEDQNEDFFWRFDNQNYIINAVDNFNPDQVLPLGLKTTLAGNVVISIQELENIPDNIDIFIHDIQLDTYHNLKESDFVINLPQGNYMNRFEVTFNDNALDIEDMDNTTLEVSYLNSNESIAITNPNGLSFTSVEMFNVLGQSIYKITKNLSSESYQELKAPLASGSYIIKLKTSEGAVLSKKVLVD